MQTIAEQRHANSDKTDKHVTEQLKASKNTHKITAKESKQLGVKAIKHKRARGSKQHRMNNYNTSFVFEKQDQYGNEQLKASWAELSQHYGERIKTVEAKKAKKQQRARG